MLSSVTGKSLCSDNHIHGFCCFSKKCHRLAVCCLCKIWKKIKTQNPQIVCHILLCSTLHAGLLFSLVPLAAGKPCSRDPSVYLLLKYGHRNRWKQEEMALDTSRVASSDQGSPSSAVRRALWHLSRSRCGTIAYKTRASAFPKGLFLTRFTLAEEESWSLLCDSETVLFVFLPSPIQSILHTCFSIFAFFIYFFNVPPTNL